MNEQSNILKNLWLVGLNHRSAPVEVREKLSFTSQQMIQLIETARKIGITSILPVSTCNRLELYAIAEQPEIIINLLLKTSKQQFGGMENLRDFLYIKNSSEAVAHLFRVTAGLDSQIIGDAQITSQVNDFLQLSLLQHAVDAMIVRMTENAIAVGKKIKTRAPAKSIGYSIADEAVKLITNSAGNKSHPGKFLVIGAGDMSTAIIKRLLKSVSNNNVTVINRTNAKATHLAEALSVNAKDYNLLRDEIFLSDYIFSATSAQTPIITEHLLKDMNLRDKTFIDLSHPRNIEPGLAANVTDISQLTDSDRQKKEAYVRLAEELIAQGLSDYYNWLSRFDLAQSIKTEIHGAIFQNDPDDPILNTHSKFVDGITSKYLRHFQKDKQSRNLAA